MTSDPADKEEPMPTCTTCDGVHYVTDGGDRMHRCPDCAEDGE